ncbi:very short patch repair endonuclease [Propionibacterium freudenreichii]|uniref:very short patch repair endonuclease n=1 Tax=Propionibacterium freudenreichii TaxID=1744 RepID=UPI00054409E0|nr:very short patch repair endonuclease [Propionibacterium freudenreichii]MCT2994679.1 very short patch repair endonuclease [Propionibacterium freudenreichii]MDK9671139.1 very short patch repair endonuclease [Propionibacterium freudenreichii]CEH00159.1 NaeI very short patch repair endonuclease (V.NaeI) [Propionibacterium freudenreichii]CEH04366.1 NaeI very short patch repair endonuclease (V.NaeI) [Propionibacterium freudenreichii]CEI49599.1 NaeI very short patch repair endonuclease (V.NaeI) [P
MSHQKVRDTSPEVALRHALFALGLRYRVDSALPGMPRRRADITFRTAKVAVFVDGCFWHGCPEHYVPPKHNADWWHHKIHANQERDADTDMRLRAEGWTPVRIWEHEPVEQAVEEVLTHLPPR